MPDHLRAFLIALGVADQPHSGRTFIEHCEGVYRLLLAEHGYSIALAAIDRANEMEQNPNVPAD